jgi:endoglucanase
VTDDLLARLRPLAETAAPSGREAAVRELVLERWRPHAAVEVDAVGNVVARVGGRGPRLLVAAHMDEIGYVVRHITDDGFLMLDTAQGARRAGPEPRHMVGHRASVLGRHGVAADGLFASASGHVLRREQEEKGRLGWDDFFVDLGLDTRDDVEACGVHVGSPVVFAGEVRAVGRRLVGKAMDDRMLLLVIELLLERLDRDALRYELHAAATVQEETGVHGIRALAHERSFDRAIALDVGLVGDVPTVGRSEYEAVLGGGPTLVHKDALVAYDTTLTWELADAADAAGIPYQHGVYAGYGSDGVALVGRGIPTALIGVPTRYTHSPFEMIDPRDVELTVELLTTFVTGRRDP